MKKSISTQNLLPDEEMPKLHFIKAEAAEDVQYRIVEIFESLQGEGYNTGMPSVFLRFGRCNLSCHWCDTNYNEFDQMSREQIWTRLRQYDSKNIIITGGEPTIQPHIRALLQFLRGQGYFLAIETNGLAEVPTEIDYIATSPKRLYADRYEKYCIERADEVRIVVDEDIFDFCEYIEGKIKAQHYFLSPCEIDGRMNVLETITLLGKLNARPNSRIHWQLSIQSHKLARIE